VSPRRAMRLYRRLAVADASTSRCASVEVFDDLSGPRPLVRGDDQVNISPPKPIQRPICHATRVETQCSGLIAPRHPRLRLFERAHRLPALQPRIADGHQLFRGDPTLQETRNPHVISLRITPHPARAATPTQPSSPLGDPGHPACRAPRVWFSPLQHGAALFSRPMADRRPRQPRRRGTPPRSAPRPSQSGTLSEQPRRHEIRQKEGFRPGGSPRRCYRGTRSATSVHASPRACGPTTPGAT